MAWTNQEIKKLRALASSRTMFFTEIAKELNRNTQTVRWKARELGIEYRLNDRIGKWNKKHADLRLPVMKYFVTHSFEETMKKFGLTRSELKSLQSVSYRLPEYSHLRKDTRNHSTWTAKEYRFLLQNSGLMPRDWIAKKLKRGGELGIKDRLAGLNISSRTINGLTLTQYREAFGKEPTYFIQTKAGPGRNGTPTCFKIIPWVHLKEEIKSRKIKAPKLFKQLVYAMADFQEWVYEGNALLKMKRRFK